MRSVARFALLFVCTMCVLLVAAPSAHAGKIEAVRGKKYRLTRQHGPWMVMVTSFHDMSEEGTEFEGKTPDEAADELVYELRTRGIPAYTYDFDHQEEVEVDTQDRLGRSLRGHVRTGGGQIAVLAGNYPTLNNDVARKTRDWLKQYHPKCLREGVIFVPTPGRTSPLGHAFLTINPLLTPQDVANLRKQHLTEEDVQDQRLLLSLNADSNYSIFENPGPYTLVVAQFLEKSRIMKNNNAASLKDEFDRSIDNNLNYAGDRAEQLATALRERCKIEAYVWHDKYNSMVCIGSLSGPNDPQIRAINAQLFSPTNRQADPQKTDLRQGFLQVYEPGKRGHEYSYWAFLREPTVAKVPQKPKPSKILRVGGFGFGK